MYEWENELSENAFASRIHSLKAEIKRVCETTLRGNFSNPEDRKYWEKKLSKMNSELSALEQAYKCH